MTSIAALFHRQDVDIDVDPSNGSASAEGGFSTKVTDSKGRGVSFNINVQATSTNNVTTESGRTTYTATTETSVTVEGEAHTPQAGVTIAHTEGIQTSYQVSMPEEVATPEAMQAANPFDPLSMPVGTTIQVDDSHSSENEFKATFEAIRVANSITESEGSSMLVERTGETTVRVTTGPTETISSYLGVGFELGPVGLTLANNTSVSNATLHTAEFDLSTPEGLAAYNHFMATGEMPLQNGPGVSGVQTIQKHDMTSGAVVEGNVGPLDFSMNGASTAESVVTVTSPDDSFTQTITMQWGDDVPVTITRQFDSDGNEIVSERTYSYTVELTENTATLLNVALGHPPGEGFQAGQTVVVSYTQAEMEGFQGEVQDAHDASFENGPAGDHSLLMLVQDGNGNEVSTFDFAVNLSQNNDSSEWGFVNRLFQVSGRGDESPDNDVDLPGTFTVIGPDSAAGEPQAVDSSGGGSSGSW